MIITELASLDLVQQVIAHSSIAFIKAKSCIYENSRNQYKSE
jgi:hypothetical protein